MDGVATDPAQPGPRPRTLRSRLLVLTFSTLLPMILFGVVAVVLIGQRERAIFQRGATERTRALLTAVDTELYGHATSLLQLASSPTLISENLVAFHDDLVRTLPTQPYWRRIDLTLPSGDRLLDSSKPPGTVLSPLHERPSFDRVLETQSPAVASLFLENGGYQFAVRVPVMQDGDVAYVLSAIVDPRAILNLLTPQRLPADWVGVVLDGNDRIVARTMDHEHRFGHLASDSLRGALARAPEGWFHGSTLEGTEVYTPYNRSGLSGWTVAFGIPAPAIEQGATRAMAMLALGIAAALAIAVLLATWQSRLIAAPIAALASTARTLERGGRIARPRGGAVREVHEVAAALADAGAAVREREDALRAADRAKDEFLAMLAHELRNPLGALSSAAQVLQETDAAEGPAKRAAAIVRRQVSHMARMVDDLLDVGRVTIGKIALSRRHVDLGGIADGVVAGLRAAGDLRRHEVRLETSSAWIDGDETRLGQIVANLVGNAVKYTPPGGRVTVRVARQDDRAVIEVADTGIGLSPELASRAFDLFVQGDRALDRSPGGLGIGLTLVKRLAELHDGTVAATSDGPGQGARFTVSFPAVDPPTEDAVRTPAPPTPRRPARVLLVEDNDDARESLAAALTLRGYQVVDAADGAGALAATATAAPEVAIVDIGLPGIDGYEVARRLRSRPGGAAALLIALSGYREPESRRRAMGDGFDEYLTKPTTADRLARLIEEHLASRAAGDGATPT